MLLQAHNISKSIGAQRILETFSLHIAIQDHIGIVGANGTGKTTLLSILAGESEADEGTIRRAEELRIGYFTQSTHYTEKDHDTSIATVLAKANEQIDTLAQQMHSIEADMINVDTDTLPAKLLAYEELQTRFELLGGYTYE